MRLVLGTKSHALVHQGDFIKYPNLNLVFEYFLRYMSLDHGDIFWPKISIFFYNFKGLSQN